MSLSKIDFTNKYTSDDLIVTSLQTICRHPYIFVKTLIQIGFEPIKPVLAHSLFWGPQYKYPNVFKYWSYINKNDGLTGLFRGTGHHLLYEISKEFSYINTLYISKQLYKLYDQTSQISLDVNDKKIESKHSKEDGQTDFRRSLKFLIEKLMLETCSKTLALTISYPFQVCLVRSCAEFIGREKIYCDFPVNLIQILKIGGLYDGFIPKLFSDIIILWLTSTLIYSFKTICKPNKIIEMYVNLITNLLVPSYFYSYQLTSTVMAINQCNSLLASKLEPRFLDWTHCRASLIMRNQSKRGNNLLMRYVTFTYKPQSYPRVYLDKKS